MKKLLFLLLLIPFLGNSQATFTAPVGYNTGAPTATPSGVGTRWRFDLLTGKKYTWLPGSLSWDEDARGIDQVAGCSAPLYTPGYNQSTFAVNSCTVPELYQWTGAAWVRLNEGEVYTAGTGISIDGSNVISNTAPNVVQELSIAGQDLTLSNGGGTVEIPSSTVSEPENQLVYGGAGGVGVDSDTGATYAGRILKAPNLRILSTTNDSSGIIYEGNVKMFHFYTADNDSIVGDNIFIGRDAGNFTLGYEVEKYESKRNIAIGKLALNKVTTGYFNTVIGWESCKELTTGAGNIVVGNHALEILETGHDNAAIGDAAMKKNVTGWYNQAIGYESLYENISGDGNAAIGRWAGSALTGGDYNTFLGYGSNINAGIAATVTNSTALGANANITKSNQVVLGSSTVTEILAPSTIVGAKTGSNLRLTADGTDGADAGIYVGSTGNINFGSWDNSRGLLVAATTGNVSQLGSGNFKTNKLGVNGSADATHALKVTGSSAFSGTVNFNNVGNNVRLGSTSGATSTDGFLGVGGSNNILLSNYDVNRGWDIKSTGIIEQIGNYALKIGSGAGVPTGAVGYIKHNTSTRTFQCVPVGTTFVDIVTADRIFNGNFSGTGTATTAFTVTLPVSFA